MDTSLASVEDRLMRLERENRALRRQYRRTQLVLGLCAALLLGINCAGTPSELILERLSLRDAGGRLFWQVGPGDDDEWVSQRFFDAAGTERIRLAVASDGTARQRLYDQRGRVRVSSSTYAEDHAKAPGVAGSVYYDPGGSKRLRLATDAKGKAVLQLKDGEGENRLQTAVDAAGTVEHKVY